MIAILAHQNQTIAIASDFRVDGAKSPEILQKEGVSASEIATRNRKSLATFHRTSKSQCKYPGNRLRFLGSRMGIATANRKNRSDFGALRSQQGPKDPATIKLLRAANSLQPQQDATARVRPYGEAETCLFFSEEKRSKSIWKVNSYGSPPCHSILVQKSIWSSPSVSSLSDYRIWRSGRLF